MRVEIFNAIGQSETVFFTAEILSFTKEMGRSAGTFRVSKNDPKADFLGRMKRVRFYLQKGVSEQGACFVGVIDEIEDTGNSLEVGCRGMFFVLEKRIKSRIGTQNAGQAMFDVLASCNADYATSIIEGVNTCTVNTGIQANGEVSGILEDIGKVCEYDIDTDFALNIADRLGEDKNIRLHYSENFAEQNTIKSYELRRDSDTIANKIILRNNTGLSSVVVDTASRDEYGLCEEQMKTTLVSSQSDLDALANEFLELKKEGINEITIIVKNKVMVQGISRGLSVFDVSLGDSIEFAIKSREIEFSGRRRIKKISWKMNSNGHIDLELSFSLFGSKLNRELSESAEKRLARIEEEVF